jgi:hypothetical protein
MKTRFTRTLVAVLVLIPTALSASAIRAFHATADRTAEAATKSINACGIITATSDGGRTIEFAVGESWGRLAVTEKDGIAAVDIVSNSVHTWSGDHRPDKAILERIAADLAGKPINIDQKSRDKAIGMERKRAEIRNAPYVPPAPAGPATVIVPADRETVKSALIAECAAKGFAISGETEHAITVFKDADAGFNFVGRVLFGNAAVRAYRANIQFMLSSENGGTRVMAAAEVLAQNGYGGIGRQVVTEDPQAKAVLQSVLDGAKARIEQH